MSPLVVFSESYIDTFRNVYEQVYNVDPNSDDTLDDSLWERNNKFYGISTPEHEVDKLEPAFPYITVDKLILLHEIAMDGTDNDYVIGEVRNSTTWAYNPIFPILHSPPEHLHPLLSNLCYWINHWLPRVTNMSSSRKKEFALSLIPRIVMIHPYMDGNKRTSRLLANILLHRLNMSIVEWNFSNHELRTQYQRRFGLALVSGNLGSGLELHTKVPGFPKFTEAAQGQYYESLGVTLFGERGAVH